MTSQKLVLAYWAVRNRAGAYRNLLDYCGLSWTNKLLDEEADKSTDNKNVPYLLDGEKKISGTMNLLNYIPRKADKKILTGETKDRHKEVEGYIKEAMILKDELNRIVEKKGDFETAKKSFFTGDGNKGRTILHDFDQKLKGKEWLVEDLSIADFYLFEQVDLIHDMGGEKLKNLPHLLCFRNRFAGLQQVKAHRSSTHFIQLWFLPETTCWNNEEKLW